MRISLLSGSEKIESQDFSNFLINIGEGNEKNFIDKNDNNDCIKIKKLMLRYNDEMGTINTVSRIS